MIVYRNIFFAANKVQGITIPYLYYYKVTKKRCIGISWGRSMVSMCILYIWAFHKTTLFLKVTYMTFYCWLTKNHTFHVFIYTNQYLQFTFYTCNLLFPRPEMWRYKWINPQNNSYNMSSNESMSYPILYYPPAMVMLQIWSLDLVL